jgi:hypothetical protein
MLGDATPGPPGSGEGIEKIRAVSDFAPIKERIRRCVFAFLHLLFLFLVLARGD